MANQFTVLASYSFAFFAFPSVLLSPLHCLNESFEKSRRFSAPFSVVLSLWITSPPNHPKLYFTYFTSRYMCDDTLLLRPHFLDFQAR